MFECGLGPGGWVWTNYVQGFSTSGDRDGDGVMDPKYFLHEMNLSGFVIPNNGRWALDPACLLYTSPSPRDATLSRMPSSA